MKKFTACFFSLFLFPGLCSDSMAAPKGKRAKKSENKVALAQPEGQSEADVLKSVREKFQATFRNFKVESVAGTPIDGIYEIVMNSGAHIVYYSPRSGHLFFGDLVSKDLKSVTQERRSAVMEARLKDIPLDQAIRIGKGKHIVIEFTDPDCSFCRKAAEYLKGKDVTKYVFMRPLAQLHPKAAEKSIFILSSSDPERDYYDIMAGKYDKEDLSKAGSPAASERLASHGRIAEKIGIQGTPTFWIDGKIVAGANFRLMDALLKY
jgi:thiol:disulfide interchange protein DsbC